MITWASGGIEEEEGRRDDLATFNQTGCTRERGACVHVRVRHATLIYSPLYFDA